jgi:hypothetical protein
MTQSMREMVRKQELALAETLKQCRARMVAHVEVGEGAGPVSSCVYHIVQDLVESADDAIAALTGDRDGEVDDAIEALDRG